jgi:hypothetical protein
VAAKTYAVRAGIWLASAGYRVECDCTIQRSAAADCRGKLAAEKPKDAGNRQARDSQGGGQNNEQQKD